MYPEYTGTGFLVILNTDEAVKQKLIGDKDEVYDYVKSRFREKYNIVWLPPLGFNNTYALMMREEHAEKLGIETISGLSEILGNED